MSRTTRFGVMILSRISVPLRARGARAEPHGAGSIRPAKRRDFPEICVERSRQGGAQNAAPEADSRHHAPLYSHPFPENLSQDIRHTVASLSLIRSACAAVPQSVSQKT